MYLILIHLNVVAATIVVDVHRIAAAVRRRRCRRWLLSFDVRVVENQHEIHVGQAGRQPVGHRSNQG